MSYNIFVSILLQEDNDDEKTEEIKILKKKTAARDRHCDSYIYIYIDIGNNSFYSFVSFIL